MKVNAVRAEYYTVIIEDGMHAAAKMLAVVSKVGISLLAYKSVAMAANKTMFTLFARRDREMAQAIRNEGLETSGPFPGIFIHGDDESGALADIFGRLARSGIIVKESCGIADINGGYGVVLYLDDADVEKAFLALSGR